MDQTVEHNDASSFAFISGAMQCRIQTYADAKIFLDCGCLIFCDWKTIKTIPG